MKYFFGKRYNFFSYLFLLLVILFVPHCSRRGNSRLGADYYKMSSVALEGVRSNAHSYRESLQHIDRALSQEVRPEYLAHKATLLFLLGEVSESHVCFKRALKLPMSASVRAEIMNNYACLVARGGDRDRALGLFKRLEGDKDYLTPEVALVNQAKLYYESGEYRLAKGKLLRAVSIAPEYVDAHYYLGLVCYALGEYGSVLSSVKVVLGFESGHVGALALRNLVSGRS